MKTDRIVEIVSALRRQLALWALVLGLIPAAGLTQTNLVLTFDTPATNTAAGAPFSGLLTYAPTNVVLSAWVTSGASIVPEANLSLSVSPTDLLVTLAPLTNTSGLVSVKVEGVTGSVTNEVVFDVWFRRYAPILTIPDTVTMDEDETKVVPFTIQYPDRALDDGALTIWVESSNTGLIDAGDMAFGGTGENRTLTLVPKADINGFAEVTIHVSDDDYAVSDAFGLTVDPVPDPPTIDGLVDVLFGDDANVTNVFSGIVVADVDHDMPDPETLTVTLTMDSDVYGTFDNGLTVYSVTGSPSEVTDAIRNLGVRPTRFNGPIGTHNTLNVSVGVTDGVAWDPPVSQTVELTIEVVNTPPTFRIFLEPDTVGEGQSIQPFHIEYIEDPDVGEDTFTLVITFDDPAQANLGSFYYTNSLTDNVSGLMAEVRNLAFQAASGVMTTSSLPIVLRFELSDGAGGTAVETATLTLLQAQSPPSISGIPSVTIDKTDGAPAFHPYPEVLVTDPDQAVGGGPQTVSAVLSQSNPALGAFSVTNLFLQHPANLTEALRAVTYAPEPGALPVGQTAETILTLTATDESGLSAQNSALRIRINSVNNPPQILNVPPIEQQPLRLPPVDPLRPFANLGLTNDETNNVLFTLSIDDAAKGTLTNLGAFAVASPGQYQMTGSVDDILLSLTNITYALNPAHLFPPDDPGGTTFTLSARDFALLTTTRTLYIQVQDEPRNHLVTRALNDGLPGSFLYALEQAGNNDVITFALPAYPAVIRMPGATATLLVRNLNIKGPGANLLTISGDGNGDKLPNRQLFRIAARVTIEGVTLSHGTAMNGGAIQVRENGDLTLRNCSVVDSIATEYGGAIDVDGGKLTLDGCFIGWNRLSAGGGMSGAGVAVYSDQEIRILNTTFAGNVQPNEGGHGGGALVVQNRTPGTLMNAYITHSTFVDNADASQRASSALSVDFGTRIRPANSIFADGSARVLNVAGTGEFLSRGGNIADDSTRVVLTQQGQSEEVYLLDHLNDLVLTDPKLAPLNAFGDPTPFREPLPGSPVINKEGFGSGTAIDQRGVMRLGAPDAGAIEFNALRRLVVNEINFDDARVNFVEIYVRRDSAPVDLAGYSLLVDGVAVHDFSDGTIIGTNEHFAAHAPLATTRIDPGFGLVVAFTNSPVMITSSNNPTPVVRPSRSDAILNLALRGELTIGQGGGQGPVARQSWLGVYMDPVTGTNVLPTAGNSLSLAPQFRGFSLVPHSFILPGPFGGVDTARAPTLNPASPGADAMGTPFGQDNAEPLAVPDLFTVTEDESAWLDVLANDFDGDGNDRLVIVDVSTGPTPGVGDMGVTTSALGAVVMIDPAAVPLRGARIHYDPRLAPLLQQLPVGVEIVDSFYYEIIDIGSAAVQHYTSVGGIAAVHSSNHRLATGDAIVLSGASATLYNGTHVVTVLDDDRFTIPVSYTPSAAPLGMWETVQPRTPTSRDSASVSVRVIGVNDPPVAVLDGITNVTEISTVRLMVRPELAGTPLSFPSDPVPPPSLSAQNLLENDYDVDSDDSWGTLRVIGVMGAVNPIADYSGVWGQTPVTVQAPWHGLSTGAEVLIAQVAGHPSYHGYHTINVLDADRFTIPRYFTGNPADKGVWVVLNDANRYDAVTDVDAGVTLTLRANPTEDHLIYDASASVFLKGLAEGELYTNRFWYAVADSHGAIGIGPVDVIVEGLNDPPVANPDPDSLASLLPLVTSSNTLEQVLENGLDLMYTLPPAAGGSNVTDLYVLDLSGTLAGTIVLNDFFVTDENTPLLIATPDLLANDTDIDRHDVLDIVAVDDWSREQAALTLSGGVITYDPTVSSNLQALVREQMRIDTFRVVVSDGMTAGVATSLVAVLVIGVNDTPVAHDVFHVTNEDERFVFDPRDNDIEIDIDGVPPDDRLRIVAVTNLYNPGLAWVDVSPTNVVHDARVSDLLNQLADWQSFTNVFAYTITDNSFLFAVDDLFYVPAGTQNRMLDVLANDRDFTDSDGMLTILDAGPCLHGGTVAIDPGGQYLVYSAPVDFVGEDTFRYTIQNDKGDANSGRVTVRSVIPPLNGILHAANDFYTVAAGETIVMDVTANDNLLPLSGAGLTVTGLISSSLPGQPVLAGNAFVFAATNGLTPLTFTYEVSAGGTARTTADVLVNIVDRRGTLNVQDDAFSVLAGSFNNELDVLRNDGLVTAATGSFRIQALLDAPAHGALAINPAGTRLIYTPYPDFIGVERIGYRVTDQIGGTGTGTISIAVGRIETVADFFKLEAANLLPVDLDVLANDRMMPAPRGTLTLVSVLPPETPTAIGTLAVNGAGNRLQFQASGLLGQAEFGYVVQDASVPPLTATGQVSIATVGPGTYANPNRYRVRGGGSGYVLDVLANDRGYPEVNRSYSILGIGTGVDAPSAGGSVAIVDNQLVYTPATGFFGEESFTYTLSDAFATDVTQVTVSVRRGDLQANDDHYAVFYEWDAGAGEALAFELPVTLNDRIQPPLDQTFAIVALGAGANAPDHGGTVAIVAGGQALRYRPQAVPTPAYTETFTYEIADGSDRRASGSVHVRVRQRESTLTAVTQDDAFSVARNSINNLLPVLANDFVRPGTAAGWTITSVSPTLYGAAVHIDGSNLLYSPTNDFVGVDHFSYSVSDGLGGTGNATVTVRVGSLPTLPSLFTVLSGSIDNNLNVLANDVLFDSYAGEYVLDDVFGATQGGTVVPSGSNTVLYTPNPAHAGPWPYTERFDYRLLDDSLVAVIGRVEVIVHDAASGRDSATITLLVEGRNDPPVILNEPPNLPITDKDTALPFVAVTIIEVDQQLQEPIDVRVEIDDSAKGRLLALGPFVDLGGGVYALTNVTGAAATTAIRDLVYEPVENRITVPTTETVYFTIIVTDHKSPDVVDTQTAIAVTAVNDPPVIDGTWSGQRFYYRLPVRPFPTVTITEVDDLTLQPLTVTVTVLQPTHGVLSMLKSFVAEGGGVYSATNLTAAAATERLRGLTFSVVNHEVPVGGSLSTQFLLSVDDGFAPPVTDSDSSVIAFNAYDGTVRPADQALQGEFGLAVDIRSDFAIIGASLASVNGTDSGAAFVYRHDSGSPTAWTEWRLLLPATVGPGDRFGRAVSMSESLIAVAAPAPDAADLLPGSLYLFNRDLGGLDNWGEWLRLAPTNLPSAGRARFGWSVALDGDRLAVGAPRADLAGDGSNAGAVFLFERHQGGLNAWGEIMRWAPVDVGRLDGDFGWSVALDGDTLIVGAPQYNSDTANTTREGAIFHFDRHAGGSNQWGMVQTFTAPEVSQARTFGWAVTVDDRRLAVGAPMMSGGAVAEAGRVYLYDRPDAAVPFVYRHQMDRRNDNERQFGYSLVLDHNLLLVGAPFNGGIQDENLGAAYLFYGGTTLSDWSMVEKFVRPDGSLANLFGRAVGMQQGAAVIGAPASLRLGVPNNRGHAYFYRFDYEVLDGNAPLLSIRDVWNRLHFGDARNDEVLQATFWGGTADPDRDTVNNDQEYAFGGDPGEAGAGDVGMLWMTHAGGGNLIFQYARRSDDPALVFTLKGSADMINWFDLSGLVVTENAVPLADDIAWVTLQVQVPPGEPVLFFKIMVEW